MKLRLIAAACAALIAAPAAATPLTDAVAAYNSGDYAKTASMLQPIAEQGDRDAQYILGMMYDRGDGVARDHAQAFLWLRKSAEQGDRHAQRSIVEQRLFNLAPVDAQPEVAIWCRDAADAGKATGDTCLGFYYSHGMGVPKDVGQGLAWWEKAAALGDTQADAAPGSTYMSGRGVAVDYAKAIHWDTMGAEQGNPFCMYNLAVMADLGQGGAPDLVRAHVWVELAIGLLPAANPAFAMATRLRDQTAAHLSPDQLAKAALLTAEWRAQHPAAVGQ